MSYRCLQTQRFSDAGYELVPYREQDIFLIKAWRNEQIDVLRQSRPLSDDDQQRYYDSAVKPAFESLRPPMTLFSYLYDAACIGYGGLTHLDWEARRAEVSFLISTARSRDHALYEQDFSTFLRLLKHVAFDALGLNRLFAETFDIRPHHVRILEQAGFRLEGRLREHARVRDRPVDSLIHGLLRSDL